LRNPKFSGLSRTPTCDGRTDRRTHDDGKYRAIIASREQKSRESDILQC